MTRHTVCSRSAVSPPRTSGPDSSVVRSLAGCGQPVASELSAFSTPSPIEYRKRVPGGYRQPGRMGAARVIFPSLEIFGRKPESGEQP